MTLCQSLFLALVQGVTEFLPVSSSGHLVLFQRLFGISQPPVLFDVLLHLGTLVAIIFFLRRELVLLVKEWKKRKNEWLFLIVGSVPAAFFGFLLSFRIEEVFDSLFLVGVMWILFGGVLLSTRFLIKSKSLTREKNSIGLVDGFVIGLFQAAALFPGISRSGSTIIGSMFRKFSKETCFYLTFLLSIPAVLGANILKISDGESGNISLTMGVFSVIIAGVSGFFSLKFFHKVFKSEHLFVFGFYCLVLGVIVLLKLGVYSSYLNLLHF